jgi:hypothetical protein
MSPFGLEYIYTWNCHKKTPCIAILNKLFFSFTKLENRRAEQVLSGRVGTRIWGKGVGGYI